MKSRNLFLIAFAVYIVFMLAAIITPARAQDEATPTAEGTEVVSLPAATPEPVVTPEGNNEPSPQNGLTLEKMLPYIVPVSIIAVLAFFALMGGVIFALWKSVPSTIKPIVYPMLQSGGNALIDIADTYTKTTSSKADDALVVELRQEFNTKLKALYEEMQAQLVAKDKQQADIFEKHISEAITGVRSEGIHG